MNVKTLQVWESDAREEIGSDRLKSSELDFGRNSSGQIG